MFLTILHDKYATFKASSVLTMTSCWKTYLALKLTLAEQKSKVNWHVSFHLKEQTILQNKGKCLFPTAHTVNVILQ